MQEDPCSDERKWCAGIARAHKKVLRSAHSIMRIDAVANVKRRRAGQPEGEEEKLAAPMPPGAGEGLRGEGPGSAHHDDSGPHWAKRRKVRML